MNDQSSDNLMSRVEYLLLALDICLFLVYLTGIVLASIYFHDCPADPAITIGILVTGCLGVLSLTVTNINRYRIRQLFKRKSPIGLPSKDLLTLVEYCLAIFVIVALITTSVFVFLNHDVEHRDKKSIRYCHKIFYKTIFIGLIVIYASAALIVSSLCCVICMIGCCAAFWNASTVKEPDSKTDRLKATSGGSFADKMEYLGRLYEEKNLEDGGQSSKTTERTATPSRPKRFRKSTENFRLLFRQILNQTRLRRQNPSKLNPNKQ